MFLKFQPFLTTWSFCSTTFQKLPKWPKLVQISKSQNFYPKYASGTIFKLFGPLETKLRSRLESNIAPMGVPKNNFCKAPYGVPHTKISAWKAKNFVLGDLCYDVFDKGSLNDFSQPLSMIKVNNLHWQGSYAVL